MTSILHASDPHFGTEIPSVVEALVAFAGRVKPDVLVLSGDITQRAKSHQFSAAKAFVQRLGIERRLIIAGNHDISLGNPLLRAVAPYHHYSQAFPGPLEPTLNLDDVLLLGVRTTRRYRHVDGEVSSLQIARVSTALRRARPGQLRVVVTHQPARVVRERDEHNLLINHSDATRAWTAAGADLILGGHIHLPYVTSTLESGLEGKTWVVQAGTCVSSRIRHEAPNSVNLIRYESTGRACTVERWDCSLDDGSFRLSESRSLPLRILRE